MTIERKVSDLLAEAALRVEDGNHGEYRPRPTDFVPEGVAYVRAADMASGVVDFISASRINDAAVQRIRKGIGQSGDVLLSHKGTVGKVATVPPDAPEFVCSPQTTFWRSLDPRVIDQRYLSFALNSKHFQRQLDLLKSQSDMAPYVSLTDQRSMTLLLPPVGEQQAIAEVLGALDDKITANRKVMTTTLDLADAEFVSSVDTTMIRRTFGEVVADGLLTLSDGYRTKRTEYGQPGLRILRAGDVRDGEVHAGGPDFVSEHRATQVGAKASQGWDVIVTTKGTVGRVAVVPPHCEQLVYSPQICFFRSRGPELLDQGFLAGWIRSAGFHVQSELVMYKSDMAPYISLTDMRAIEMPVPVIDTQHRIGARQKRFHEVFFAMSLENEKLAATRDELLPLLMSGKLRVRDAEKQVREVV